MYCLPINEIIQRYKNGESSQSIANYFNVGILAIQRRLRKAREINAIGWTSKKYSINKNYFDVIDNEHKAYWLGIFLTDGSTSGAVRLNLQTGDEDHIRKLQLDIGSNHPIRRVKEGKCGTSCLHIGNKHMVSSLREKGIVPNNKRIWLPEKRLQRHYWRGAIDGDGCISFSNYNLSLSLCGTKETCLCFSKFCKLFVNTNAKIEKHRNIFNFRLHGDIALIMCKVLYEDCTIFLSRKKEKYLECKKIIEENTTVINGILYRKCQKCGNIKQFNKKYWAINKNNHMKFGRCLECFKQSIKYRKKREYVETKLRAEDDCPMCNMPLSNTNKCNSLRYVGCKKCGYKAGSYRI